MIDKLENYKGTGNNKKELGEINFIIAARLRHLRNIHNMTQAELGRRIGLGGTAIANYEKPYCEISIVTLNKIAAVLGVDISYFVGNEETSNVNLKLSQPIYANCSIPYYKTSNISGMLLNDKMMADFILSLPCSFKQAGNIICTDIPDNSMIVDDYKRGELIFVDTDARPANGDVALIYDTASKKMIVRKFISDGPMVTLMASGHSDIPPIYTDIADSEYKIIGPVVRSTRDH